MIPVFVYVQDNDEGSNNQGSSTATAVPSAASHNVLPRDTLTAMDVDATVSLPFAVVDEIAEASPAAEDGLQLGDRIVKFGNVEAGDNLLPRLASEAQTNHGHAIPVIVMRQGALINLTMTPRTWQGRGLLGYVLHSFFPFFLMLLTSFDLLLIIFVTIAFNCDCFFLLNL